MTEPPIAADLEPPATVDYLSRTGAEALAETIRARWADHPDVRVWVELDAGTWSVRSNLKRGQPPPAASCG
jgi:hypothetical protein